MGKAAGTGGEELRRLFVEAGLKILDEPDTPLELRKVAELAGKSRTAPYLVFGKESEGGGVLALRIAVAAEGARMMARAIEEAGWESTDPVLALQRVARAFLSFVREHPRLFRLMFGPEIGVSASLGSDELRDHPEFAELSRHRFASERVVHGLIERCQTMRLAPPGDTTRYTRIAWASMLGVAFLLLDEVLDAAGVRTELDDAANLVVESVLGLDPEPLTRATHTFLAAQAKSPAAEEQEVPRRRVFMELAELRDVEEKEAVEGAPAEPGEPFGLESPAAPAARARPGGVLRSLGALGRRLPGVRYELSSAEETGEEKSAAEEEPGETMDLPDHAEPSLDMPRAGRAGRAGLRYSPAGEAPSGETPGEAMSVYSGLRRAAQSRKALYGARILWIDDRPRHLRAEVETLRSFRLDVTTARSTDQAEARLQSEAFDLILSDMDRDGDPRAGTRALPRLRRWAPDTPVIFYVGRVDPDRGVPDGAVGITNALDELIHLIVDVMERRR